MFNVKMTKNGSLAVILPNTDESKRVILSLLSGTLALPDAFNVPALPPRVPAVSDADRFEAARAAKAGKNAKSAKKQVTATYDYESLTPLQRMWEDQRYAITAAIIEYARELGKVVDPNNLGSYYTPFYAKLRANTGYAPARKTILEYYNPYVATKINTILKDGKGPDMLRIINQEIRALTPAPAKKTPRLILNPKR